MEGKIEKVEPVEPVENVEPVKNLVNQVVELDDVDDEIDIVSGKILALFRKREINSTNWMMLVINVMQCVEDVDDLNGNEKKELAIEVIVKVVPKLNKNNNQIVEKLLNRDSLSSTIDLVISASKGQLDLNKIKKAVMKCVFGCMSAQNVPISNNINDDYDFYKNTLESFKNKEINLSNWMMIITKVIQDVEEVKTINGPEKKDLAIQLTIKIYKELNLNNNDLDLLFTHSSLSSVIDTIISVSKNKINLNKKINATKVKTKK
jgi:hypothetical protein